MNFDWQALEAAILAQVVPEEIVALQKAVDTVIFPWLAQQISAASQNNSLWEIVGGLVASLQGPVDAYLQGLLVKYQNNPPAPAPVPAPST